MWQPRGGDVAVKVGDGIGVLRRSTTATVLELQQNIAEVAVKRHGDRKSTRLNSSHAD